MKRECVSVSAASEVGILQQQQDRNHCRRLEGTGENFCGRVFCEEVLVAS